MISSISFEKPIILVIDDELAILKTLKDSLEEESYNVHTINDPTKALDAIGKIIPDLVLLDIFMPNVNGLDLLIRIKKEYPHQNVIVISGFGTIAMAIDAVRLGATDFIEKPLNLDEILAKLAFLKNKISTQATKPTTTHYEDFGIIGQSYLFKELMQSVDQIALLPLPLLLYGEQGVGKTLVARYIHQQQYKNQANFVMYDGKSEETFNNLQEKILQNFLGTVYLKHIHCLSLQGQQNLLDIIRSATSKKIRFVATSYEQLFLRVINNTFSPALFNYFNVTPLEIPSINKRRYDIPLLIHHFMLEENKKQYKDFALNVASIRVMRNMHWVGNVAQLKECVEAMVTKVSSVDNVKVPEFLAHYLETFSKHQVI